MSLRILVGSCLMVVGCAGVDSSTASTVALGGVITVEGAVNGSEEKCRGPHPLFSDIERGMKIVVRDDRGDVLGTGELDAGVPYLDHRSGTQDVYFCRLPFVVGLARYVDVYDFSFGKRGGPSYTHSELEGLDWEIALTVR